MVLITVQFYKPYGDYGFNHRTVYSDYGFNHCTVYSDYGPKFHLFPRDSGKDAGRGHIQNCPRAVDCEAVKARGQFWICPRTASFPDPEEKGGILTLLTSFPTLVPFRREAFQV